MGVLGWGLFALGRLLLFFFAFVGLDTGFGNVANLAGTLTGAASLISGAVFVAGHRVEKEIKNISKERSIKPYKREDNSDEESTGEDDGHEIVVWAWVVVFIFLLGVLLLGAVLQDAR